MSNFAYQLQRLRELALADNIPVISPRNAAFLSQTLAQRRPQRVLEIGSAVGVSSAVIAHTIAEWGGRLTTVEISVPTQTQAAANLTALGLHNVQSLCGDARVLLSRWALLEQADTARFDCIFIDAHKNQTHVFYSLALPVLADGGFIMVDDAWLYRHKMADFYALLDTKKQAYSLHFVDGKDATLLMAP
jgi:predicted O-methyltransferase YrrM